MEFHTGVDEEFGISTGDFRMSETIFGMSWCLHRNCPHYSSYQRAIHLFYLWELITYCTFLRNINQNIHTNQAEIQFQHNYKYFPVLLLYHIIILWCFISWSKNIKQFFRVHTFSDNRRKDKNDKLGCHFNARWR